MISARALLVVLAMLPATALAAAEGYPLTPANADVSNISSLQRGARNFVNYCQGCHSAKYMRYSQIASDLGLTEDEVMANLMFSGERIYDTMETVMPPEKARQWFGNAPPDLSLIVRSRGADYVYTFLRSFYADPSRPTGVDNAVLQLAAMYVGVPAVPVSPAYSLVSQDLENLRHIAAQVEPGLVFAADGARFARALAAVGAPALVGRDPGPGHAVLSDMLSETGPLEQADAAHAATGPDTVAKILFTSGSTSRPKGVINTQRMLCSNQQAIAQCWPFLRARPPVLVDWLPWHHTFGGNHNFNMALYHGGSLYVDEGKPAPGLIERTVDNLLAVPPTLYFNVPRGFEVLLPYLERDEALRARFFSRLDVIFYAGAALPPNLWSRLVAVAERAGAAGRVLMASAWGSIGAWWPSPGQCRSERA